MNIIQKSTIVEGKAYYTLHLNIVNSFIPSKMTHTEIEILASFLSLSKELTGDYMFNSEARKKVMSSMNIQAGGLGNHLKSLIDKGVLEKAEYTKKISLKDYLMCDESEQRYQFILKKK